MKKIEVAASRAKQGNLELYTTAIKVRDLIAPEFYSVETLDPDDADDKGYQRLLNKARAKKLADYIVRGQDEGDAFLPTSVFLATNKSIDYDEAANTIAIDLAQTGPSALSMASIGWKACGWPPNAMPGFWISRCPSISRSTCRGSRRCAIS